MKNKILQIINDFVSKGQSFSAYNVTLELRKNTWAIHGVVRDFVYELYEEKAFFASTQDVYDQSKGVYYKQFTPTRQYAAPQNIPSIKTSLAASSIIQTPPGYPNGVLLNNTKGYVRITKALVDQAGFKPGDVLYITNDKPLTKNIPPAIISNNNTPNSKKCTVDQYGNIKLHVKYSYKAFAYAGAIFIHASQ